MKAFHTPTIGLCQIEKISARLATITDVCRKTTRYLRLRLTAEPNLAGPRSDSINSVHSSKYEDESLLALNGNGRECTPIG
jgi:hypothetical protein